MLMEILVVMVVPLLGTGHPVYLPICPLWWLAADYGPERPGIMTLLAGQDVHMQCALCGRPLGNQGRTHAGHNCVYFGPSLYGDALCQIPGFVNVQSLG